METNKRRGQSTIRAAQFGAGPVTGEGIGAFGPEGGLTGTVSTFPGLQVPNIFRGLQSFAPGERFGPTPTAGTPPRADATFDEGPIDPSAALPALGGMSPAQGGPRGFGTVLPTETAGPTAPEKPLFTIDPAEASMGAMSNEIAYLEAIPFEDRTPEQTQRLDDLYKQQESITAKGRKGKFRNELLMQMLPQLFSQPFEQSEADRQYAMEMRQYQDQQRRRAEEQEQEKQGRQQAFALVPKLFPDLGIDLSSFGGELDPSLIPALIQMAQLRASKRNQRMAQPVVRFA